MAYDEKLAERVRNALRGRGEISEKKMFGEEEDAKFMIKWLSLCLGTLIGGGSRYVLAVM